MAVKKSKVKVKPKSKLVRAKVVAKSKKVVLKTKQVRKSISIAKNPKAKLDAKPSEKISIKPVEVRASVVKRNPALVERRRPIRNLTIKLTKQFNFMKAPLVEHAFEVGDNVEVFCDHEKSKERIRGWIKGIVVQVDNKMVAVQFRSNVFLTDGWMVPDRILWYPLNSEHIRPVLNKKAIVKKEFVIPDY